MKHSGNRVDDDDSIVVVFQSLGALNTFCDQLCGFNRRKCRSAQVQEAELGGARIQVALGAQQVKAVQEYGLGEFEIDEQHIARGSGVAEPVLTVTDRKAEVHKRE